MTSSAIKTFSRLISSIISFTLSEIGTMSRWCQKPVSSTILPFKVSRWATPSCWSLKRLEPMIATIVRPDALRVIRRRCYMQHLLSTGQSNTRLKCSTIAPARSPS